MTAIEPEAERWLLDGPAPNVDPRPEFQREHAVQEIHFGDGRYIVCSCGARIEPTAEPILAKRKETPRRRGSPWVTVVTGYRMLGDEDLQPAFFRHRSDTRRAKSDDTAATGRELASGASDALRAFY